MQDSCVGTHMAVCFAFLLPFTHIRHFSPGYPSPPPPPTGPPPPNWSMMFPSLCPCVLIVQLPFMCEIIWCLVFCPCISLLRMMVFSFIHVPAKDMNSSIFVAAQYSMVYICHIFPVQSIIDGHLGWFQVFAIVNSATMNICLLASL